MSLLQEMAAPRMRGEPLTAYRARLAALADIARDLAEELAGGEETTGSCTSV